MSKTIDEKIKQFRKSIPRVKEGCPSKDFINSYDVYEVAEELLYRLDVLEGRLPPGPPKPGPEKPALPPKNRWRAPTKFEQVFRGYKK